MAMDMLELLPDTTGPETRIDPGILIRPYTSLAAEMTIIVPPDSVDPDMVLKPHAKVKPNERAKQKRLLQRDRRKEDE